jgi:hypothetical protein
VELARDLQVVVLRARSAAERLEVEPDHAAGLAPRADLARLDVQHRAFVGRLGQLVEGLAHFLLGRRIVRREVHAQLLERAAPVVGAVVHAEHFELLVEQRDRGQDAVAVQPAGIQVVGLEIGGGDEAHAVLEQRHQQPMKNHRVGDVRHVELVEADELVALGDAQAQLVQRVDRALQLAQLAVHLAHEFVEVQARLAAQRHRVEEQVHQEALAPPDATVHVDAARQLGPVDELLQRIGTLGLVLGPFVRAAIQRLHGVQLRGIAVEPARGEFLFVSLFDAQDRPQVAAGPPQGDRTSPAGGGAVREAASRGANILRS